MGEVVEFIPRNVNGVRVEQRNIDGFINGTAMCSAYDKNIVDWFRTTRTFNLFCSLAGDLGIKSNMVLHHDSDISRLSATKYAEMFPGLLYVKRGSPENGGGVWVHPDVSIDLASECNPLFGIQVARWIREWFSTGKNPVQPNIDLDEEEKLWYQRNNVRVDLKDKLRPELMNAVIAYARKHELKPRELCASVHDEMNKRIQGHKAKEIKMKGGLPLFDLMRDYFEVQPLVTYSSINKIAKNRIEDANVHPIQAVNEACDMYLGSNYQPKLCKIVENINSQGQRIKAAKAKRRKALPAAKQLNLFDNNEAV